MTYKRGDRIALVHTTDPHTDLTEGDEGTVRRYDANLAQRFSCRRILVCQVEQHPRCIQER